MSSKDQQQKSENNSVLTTGITYIAAHDDLKQALADDLGEIYVYKKERLRDTVYNNGMILSMSIMRKEGDVIGMILEQGNNAITLPWSLEVVHTLERVIDDIMYANKSLDEIASVPGRSLFHYEGTDNWIIKASDRKKEGYYCINIDNQEQVYILSSVKVKICKPYMKVSKEDHEKITIALKTTHTLIEKDNI